MKKRILSLGLSLSMLASLLAATTNIAYAEAAANEISLKYYKECNQKTNYNTWETSSPIEGAVQVGDEFYAAVELKDFERPTGATLAVEYDTSKVKLLAAKSGKELPEGEFTGNNLKGMYYIGSIDPKAAGGGSYTEDLVDQYKSSKVSTKAGFVRLCRLKSTVLSREEIEIEKEKCVSGAFMILRFKAVDSGDAGIQIIMDNPMDMVDTYKSGSYNCKSIADKFTLNNDDIKINVPGSKQLDKPANVSIEGRKVTWDAVTGAGSYKVAVEGSNGTNKEYTATANSFDIPQTDFNACKVTVRVTAVSADSTVLSSEQSDAAEAVYKIKLKTPKPVWDDNKVTWEPVDGATTYQVVVIENGAEIKNEKVTANELTVKFKDTDETVNKYTYVVKVTALGSEYADDSDAGVTEEKNILGKLKPASNLKWNGTKAEWTASPDADNVEEYRVQVIRTDKHETEEKIKATTATSVDLAEFLKEPGRYTFAVTAIGKNGYNSSATANCGAEKTVTVTLKQVTNLTWKERVLSWDDENENSLGYEVKIYQKNGENFDPVKIGGKDSVSLDKKTKSIDLREYGFNNEGTFKVEVFVLGNDIYLPNDTPATAERTFKQSLEAPTNVKWNGNKATWNAVDGATGYVIDVYYNDAAKLSNPSEFIMDAAATELDLEKYLTFDGNYRFRVMALGDNVNHDSSDWAQSDVKSDFVTTKKGTVSFKLFKNYENGELSNEVSDTNKLKGGEDLYVAVKVKGIDSINGIAMPISFNSKTVKVAGSNGDIVESKLYNGTEATSKPGFIAVGNDFKDFTVIASDNEDGTGYTEVDNENGFVNIGMSYVGEPKAVSDSDDETVVVIRFKACAKGDAEFKFAAANTDGYRYDKTSYAGLMMTQNENYVFADIVNAKTTIERGKLPKMSAPVWNGEVVTWSKLDNADKYILTIYRDGNVLDTIELGDVDAYYANELINGVYGSYTATIVAVTSDGSADNSDPSDMSEAYVRRSTGGGSLGGGKLPTKPDEPDKPAKPELTDIDGHWAEESIRRLVDGGIINGYDDNTFRPDIGTTRAEFTKLIVTALGLELDENAEGYKDTENHWAKAYIAAGTKYGIINGIGDDLFAPDVIITREQIAAIIYRIAGKPEVSESSFADRDEISDYAKSAVDYVAENGIMIGFDGNVFKGTESSTRAQIATVIDRLMQKKFFEGKLNFDEVTEKTEKVEDAEASSTETNTEDNADNASADTKTANTASTEADTADNASENSNEE